MSPRPFISFIIEPLAVYKFRFISILILLLALYMYMQLLNVVYAMTSASTRLSHCRYPLEVERSALLRGPQYPGEMGPGGPVSMGAQSFMRPAS